MTAGDTVVITPTTVTTALWPKHPHIRTNGRLLACRLQVPDAAFRCLAMDPSNSHKFAVTDSLGAVYTFDMKKNKAHVLTRLSTREVHALAYVQDPNIGPALLLGVGHRLSLLSMGMGNVVTQFGGSGVHSSHISSIVVSQRHAGYFVTQSCDSVACWSMAKRCVTHKIPVRCRDIAVAGNCVFISRERDLHAVDIITGKSRTLLSKQSNKVAYDLVTATHSTAVLASTGVTPPSLLVIDSGSLARQAIIKLPDAACAAQQLVHLRDDVVVTISTDGGIVALDVQSSELLFSLPPQKHHVPIHRFQPSVTGLFGAMSTQSSLTVFHLPTVKMHFDKQVAAGHPVVGQAPVTDSLKSFLLNSTEQLSRGTAEAHSTGTTTLQAAANDFTADPTSVRPPIAVPTVARSTSAASVAGPSATSVPHNGKSLPNCRWMKVDLLPHRRDPVVGEPLTLHEAMTTMMEDSPDAQPSSGLSVVSRTGGRSPARGGASNSTIGSGRSSGIKVIPCHRQNTKNSGGAPAARKGASTNKSRSTDGTSMSVSNSASNSDYLRNPTILGVGSRKHGSNAESETCGEVIQRLIMDQDSVVANLHKLRKMLVQYGVYPERYRKVVWRFVLRLPSSEANAEPFSNLLLKGEHPAVASLTRSYPLPESRLRQCYQRVLSCLAHHAPVFSVVHFVPELVFPFVKLFGSDVQTAFEAVLSFVHNWGREFFQTYPHPPVDLGAFLTHVLKAEDPQLHDHLLGCACDVDVWGWEVIRPLFTDVLTAAEWLQVMDHGFSNEPTWLFLFLVQWLIALREPILSMQDPATMKSFFHRCSPCNVNAIIQATYSHHSRYSRDRLPIAAEYVRYKPLPQKGGYPMMLDFNEFIVSSKLREIERIAKHEESIKQRDERMKRIEKQLKLAEVEEEAFSRRQKAVVSATHESTEQLWRDQVSIQEEKQKFLDVEHEARLHSIGEQERTAKRIERLQSEVVAASQSACQSRDDRQRETLRWDFSEKMKETQLEALENDSRARLAARYNASQLSQADCANMLGNATKENMRAVDASQQHQQQNSQTNPSADFSSIPMNNSSKDDQSGEMRSRPASQGGVRKTEDVAAAARGSGAPLQGSATSTNLPAKKVRIAPTAETGSGGMMPLRTTFMTPSAASTTSTSSPPTSLDESGRNRLLREHVEAAKKNRTELLRPVMGVTTQEERVLAELHHTTGDDDAKSNSTVTEPAVDEDIHDDDCSLSQSTHSSASYTRRMAGTVVTDPRSGQW